MISNISSVIELATVSSRSELFARGSALLELAGPDVGVNVSGLWGVISVSPTTA